jgi:hypothetical protein
MNLLLTQSFILHQSRACQRKDWKRHKEHCLAVVRVEKRLGLGFTKQMATHRRQSHKQGMRWSNALLFALVSIFIYHHRRGEKVLIP